MNLTLVRFAYLEQCTLGWLYAGGLRLATIERPWIENPTGAGGKPRESCIPDAMYNIRPHSSQKFPDTYALVNHAVGVYYQPFEIPNNQAGRSAILIHVGNRTRDLLGCIAVGLTHGMMSGEHAVLSSVMAMNQLRSVLGKDRHSLDIRPTEGTREAA